VPAGCPHTTDRAIDAWLAVARGGPGKPAVSAVGARARDAKEPDACSLHAGTHGRRAMPLRCPPGDPRPRAPGPGARVQYAPPTRPRPPVLTVTLQVLAPWLLPHESCVATAQATAQHRTVVPALSLRLTALYATFKIDTLPTHGYTLLKYA